MRVLNGWRKKKMDRLGSRCLIAVGGGSLAADYMRYCVGGNVRLSKMMEVLVVVGGGGA